MAQPQKVEMLPPKDVTKEASRLEKATFGVKNESTKILRTKANIFQPCREDGVLPLNTKVRTETPDFMRQSVYTPFK